MNYINHYNSLIQRAQNRVLEGYCERHHIIPRCMSGSNDADNIAVLTAEEHYVAHQLLVKMHPGNYKLIKAAHMMTVDSRGRRVHNKRYGWLKRLHSETMSVLHSGKTPWNKGKSYTYEDIMSPEKARQRAENHSKTMRGRKIGPQSPEHVAKLSAIRKGRIAPNKGIKTRIVGCPTCDKEGGISIMKRWHFDNCKELAHG